MIPEKLLTTKQAAKLLNRTTGTLRTWASKKWEGRRPITPIRTAPCAPLMWRESDVLRILRSEKGKTNYYL